MSGVRPAGRRGAGNSEGRGGRAEAARAIVGGWLQRDPGNEQAKALKAKLDSLGPGD